MRVHMQHEPDPDAKAVLLAALDPGVDVSFGDSPTRPDYSVLIGGRPSDELLDASPLLTSVVIPFAGVPAVTLEALSKRPKLALHNLHHNAPATAELAVALLLAAAKSVVPVDGRLRNADWSDRGEMQRALQLSGRTCVVLGYGAIGQRVARACAGLGMVVKAVARNPRDGAEHEVHGSDQLAELLPQAQALMVCLPATPATEGMIGTEQIAALPPDALLVNVARGPIIDESALYEALKARRIFAAGLDVWWNYPKSRDERASTQPSSLPFHELENVVMSPHRGGHVNDTEPQRMRALAEMLNAGTRGDELPNRVDVNAGY